MCDERSLADQDAHVRHHGALTRREFGMLTAGAGLAALWPELAHAAATAEHEVLIETPDGKTDAFFVHPAEGRHPGVILWPDAFGLRPAMRAMAKRLATSGYAVLAVNPYYRTGKAPLLPEGADFGDPETRKQIFSLMVCFFCPSHPAEERGDHVHDRRQTSDFFRLIFQRGIVDDQGDMHVDIVQIMDMSEIKVSEHGFFLSQSFAMIADQYDEALIEQVPALEFFCQFTYL